MFKNKKAFLLFFLLLISFFLFKLPAVQATDGDILGTEIVNQDIVLKSTSPQQIIVRIINIALGLLGILAVCLVIFAGFKWMTAAGNEDQISEAKKILKNGVIGLLIILAAWGLVTFIFRVLFPGDGRGNGDLNDPREILSRSGLGVIGACSVESVYPEPDQTAVARNTSIMITFKSAFATSSISASSIAICEKNSFDFNNKTCSNTTEIGSLFFAAGNTILIVNPASYLGRDDGYTDYIVYISSNSIEKEDGGGMFDSCSSDYLLWGFEVSNYLDLTPPTVGSIFPPADNSQDLISTTSELAYASASITVSGPPNYFVPASISVSSVEGSPISTGSINQYYNGDYDSFGVVIDGSAQRAMLRSNSSNLGAFNIENGRVRFTNYFDLDLPEDYEAGHSWTVSVTRRQLADTLTVGDYVYTFVNSSGTGYNIQVNNDSNVLAGNIAVALINTNPAVIASLSDNSVVNLRAKVGGLSGNNIALSSSATSTIGIGAFGGGRDAAVRVTVNDAEDRPMNSIIQINFSEAINPVSVVGEGREVLDTIRIINNKSGAKADEDNCSNNSDCLSYNCSNSKCVGNSLAGSFFISSNYKTLEFKSSNKCGINGCGEDIFCLPPMSNLRVEIKAAKLAPCGSDGECSSRSPFLTCSTTSGCHDGNNNYYPLADLNNAVGVIDAANNSFDGNRDTFAQGPVSSYNLNNTASGGGDNLEWSFWISNKIDANPPVIKEIAPTGTAVNLREDVRMVFNKLMMASTLKTGQIKVNNAIHPLINLLSGQLVGYWINSENKDVEPLDGIIDQTSAYIRHAVFYEGADYSAQSGSGVKDIYQNCFKPSEGRIGDGICVTTDESPFCCDGNLSNSPCQL